jgi:Domain of unknown function (DUF4338)
MLKDSIRIQGRTLTAGDLAELRDLLARHPDWNRTFLSGHLAQQWEWRNGAGRLKDMAARTLLLKLERRGLIQLPPPQRRTRRPCAQPPQLTAGPLQPWPLAPIQSSLEALQPIRLEVADTRARRQQVRQYLSHLHYRGFHGAVGENVQYLARDAQGRELAVMIFGAAAWKQADRDRFIGWSAVQRAQRLGAIANQQRFLILPWVRAPHLASHLLALAAGRLSADWQQRYGHPLWLVESFVEQDRFLGTAYQGAGWLCLGQTTGRTRQDRHHQLRTPLKSVWVRPLHPQFRTHLSSP